MEVREILERARSEEFRDPEAGSASLALESPLDAGRIEDLEARVGKLPAEVRRLLQLVRGFSIGAYEIRFDRDDDYPLAAALVPEHVVLGEDGTGNAWIVETGGRRGWRRVWFACHDPPSLVLQSETLAGFVEAVLNEYRPHARRDLVTEGVLREPDDLPRAGESGSEALAGLPQRVRVFEVRKRKPGEGVPLHDFGVRVARVEGHAAFTVDRGGVGRAIVVNLLAWAALCGFFWLGTRRPGGSLAVGTLVFAVVRGYASLLQWKRAEKPPGSCVVLVGGWVACCAGAWYLTRGLWPGLGYGTLGYVLLLAAAALLRR